MKKICFKCEIEKPLDDFYKHKDTSDGFLNKCKSCTKQDSINRETKLRENPLFIEKERERAREKYYRLNYKQKHKPSFEKKKEYIKNYKEKYPEKYLAKNQSFYLQRSEGNELHHWSYLKEHWTDVIELSIRHHALAHRYLIYDQERMQYRTLENILLDTKEEHKQYINLCIFNDKN
jgi:hypothetical protein